MPEFLFYALAAGWGISLVTGPVGSLLLWRRMIFLGDTLSHGALIGVALSLWLKIDLIWGILGFSCLLTALMGGLHYFEKTPSDLLLNLLSYGSLSLGILLLSQMPNGTADLSSYLFGDILACSWETLEGIYLGALLILGGVSLGWRWLLLSIVSPEIAAIEGVPVKKVNFFFLLGVSLTLALAIQVIGILLLGALLITPPATAHKIARSPEQMAFFSILLGGIAITLGLGISYVYNTPTSPTIVLTSLGLFGLSLGLKKRV